MALIEAAGEEISQHFAGWSFFLTEKSVYRIKSLFGGMWTAV